MISYNSQTMCEKFSNRVLFYIKKFENSLKLPRVLFSISLIIYTKLIKKVSVSLRMDYQRVSEFVSVSFERFTSECKKFENSLKLPGVFFSISLIIYIHYGVLFICRRPDSNRHVVAHTRF